MVRFEVDAKDITQLAQDFLTLAADTPEWQRELLKRMGRLMEQTLISTYVLDLPLSAAVQHREPTQYRGTYGQSVKTFSNVSGGSVVLNVSAEHAGVVEAGRPAGPLDSGEREAIRDWAESKLGVTDPVEQARIIHSIETRGLLARRLLQDAFSPSTPRGQQLTQQIELMLTPAIDRLMQAHRI